METSWKCDSLGQLGSRISAKKNVRLQPLVYFRTFSTTKGFISVHQMTLHCFVSTGYYFRATCVINLCFKMLHQLIFSWWSPAIKWNNGWKIFFQIISTEPMIIQGYAQHVISRKISSKHLNWQKMQGEFLF